MPRKCWVFIWQNKLQIPVRQNCVRWIKYQFISEREGEKIRSKCQSECYKQYSNLSTTLTFKFWYHRSSWKNAHQEQKSQIPTLCNSKGYLKKKIKIKKNPVLFKIKLMMKNFLELAKINYTNWKKSLINKRNCVQLEHFWMKIF